MPDCQRTGRIRTKHEPVGFSDNGRYNEKVSSVTDTYSFVSGTTPPSAMPGSPYQGSYGGPGLLVGDSIVNSTTQTIPGGATVSGPHDFDGNLWDVHLGLYGAQRLSERWLASLSGGWTIGFLNADVSWSESATLPGGGSASVAGSGSDSDLLCGFYLGANVAYDLGENWSVIGGLQSQFLDNYEGNFDGRTVELNFHGSFYLTIGISKTF